MKKTLSLLLILTALTSGAAAQDIVDRVELKVDDQEPIIKEITDVCEMSLMANRHGDEIEVSAVLRNNSVDYSFLLFRRSIPEKELKRQKIRFDKLRYGSTSRKIVPFDGLDDEICEINIGGERRLDVYHGNEDDCKLSVVFYVAKPKKKKRIIMQRIQVVLHISIKDTEKPDGNYDGISRRCNDIIAEISQVTICPGRRHGVSIEDQKAPYLRKIAEIKNEIGYIRSNNDWRENDKGYERYKELISRLNAIEFHEELCRKCSNPIPITSPSSHRCQYCNSPLETILQQMVSIYQQLDTRRITRDEARKRANQVYDCPNMKQRMRNDPSHGNQIKRYYELIRN